MTKQRQGTLKHVIASYEDRSNAVGQTLHPDEKVFRAEALIALFESNTAVECARPILALMERKTGKKLGEPHGLFPYVPCVLECEVLKIRELLDSCFSEYTITIDGSPFWAEAEIVAIRAITRKNFNLVEKLIRVAMLKKSPDAVTLCANTQDAIQNRAQRNIAHLRAVMADRARTNGAAARLLKEAKDGKLLEAKCNSHTIVKVGDKFECPDLKRIFAPYRTLVMHAGCARMLAAELYHETVELGGGVRWWVELEQQAQVKTFGLERLHSELVEVCVKNSWSEESAKKLSAILSDKPVLARGMVQLAASCDSGALFCKITYHFESNGPMSLVAYELFER